MTSADIRTFLGLINLGDIVLVVDPVHYGEKNPVFVKVTDLSSEYITGYRDGFFDNEDGIRHFNPDNLTNIEIVARANSVGFKVISKLISKNREMEERLGRIETRMSLFTSRIVR